MLLKFMKSPLLLNSNECQVISGVTDVTYIEAEVDGKTCLHVTRYRAVNTTGKTTKFDVITDKHILSGKAILLSDDGKEIHTYLESLKFITELSETKEPVSLSGYGIIDDKEKLDKINFKPFESIRQFSDLNFPLFKGNYPSRIIDLSKIRNKPGLTLSGHAFNNNNHVLGPIYLINEGAVDLFICENIGKFTELRITDNEGTCILQVINGVVAFLMSGGQVWQTAPGSYIWNATIAAFVNPVSGEPFVPTPAQNFDSQVNSQRNASTPIWGYNPFDLPMHKSISTNRPGWGSVKINKDSVTGNLTDYQKNQIIDTGTHKGPFTCSVKTPNTNLEPTVVNSIHELESVIKQYAMAEVFMVHLHTGNCILRVSNGVVLSSYNLLQNTPNTLPLNKVHQSVPEGYVWDTFMLKFLHPNTRAPFIPPEQTVKFTEQIPYKSKHLHLEGHRSNPKFNVYEVKLVIYGVDKQINTVNFIPQLLHPEITTERELDKIIDDYLGNMSLFQIYTDSGLCILSVRDNIVVEAANVTQIGRPSFYSVPIGYIWDDNKKRFVNPETKIPYDPFDLPVKINVSKSSYKSWIMELDGIRTSKGIKLSIKHFVNNSDVVSNIEAIDSELSLDNAIVKALSRHKKIEIWDNDGHCILNVKDNKVGVSHNVFERLNVPIYQSVPDEYIWSSSSQKFMHPFNKTPFIPDQQEEGVYTGFIGEMAKPVPAPNEVNIGSETPERVRTLYVSSEKRLLMHYDNKNVEGIIELTDLAGFSKDGNEVKTIRLTPLPIQRSGFSGRW